MHQLMHSQKRRVFFWLGVVFAITIMVLILDSHYSFSQVKERVRIGLPLQQQSSLAIIAAEKGFYSKEGLAVTVKEYPSGKRAVEGMLAGAVDVASTAETPIVFASFERQDFSIIASIGSSGDLMRIIARKDKGIQKPGDLRGKRIAVQKGSATHFFLHIFLLKNGLSEKDVNLSFKKVEELPEALASGEIDAFSQREPFIGEAKGLLGDNAVVFAEPGIYFLSEEMIALNSLIKDKPEVINRLLRSLLQAERFAREHPDQAIKIVSNKLKSSESEISALWNGFDFTVSLKQVIFNILEDEARWAINSKLTDKTKVPNYLNFIYLKGLEAVKPEAVTIIR
ncbi:MAG: NrtA/SsuA/CpmA family ABC transporter substrate-binding protein [Deltaproteobacteria bacterium]|nr:NrtA/SsuA/CpmA family ABC transporter substrate-binding protein [Deltaproteobacteria bacterium]